MKYPHARHLAQLSRLRRIEGQVRGLVRMVEDERYCVDILTQLRAARAALKRGEEGALRAHVERCGGGAIRGGNAGGRRPKEEELLARAGRFRARCAGSNP